MARDGVLAIGLDCFEISLAEGFMEQGCCPRWPPAGTTMLACCSIRAAIGAGLRGERFWSGLGASDSDRQSAVEFDATTTRAGRRARVRAFFGSADVAAAVFDALVRRPGPCARGPGTSRVGAHDPGLLGPGGSC